MTISKFAALCALFAFSSIFTFAQIIPPGGRLTLTSNTPVMTSDVVNGTTVYYTNYNGDSLPSVGGGSASNQTITAQIALTLNSSWELAGSVHDIFVFFTTGWNICAGPAWSNPSASPWRGSGAGTTQLTQQPDGLWVNAVLISNCYNGTSDDSFAAGYGLYVGSVYMTANGQTSMVMSPGSAAGGTNNVLGLYNAYNRVTTTSLESDSNSSWTYATPTWRPADGGSSNLNNRITYLDGLQQSSVRATYVIETTTTNGVLGVTGVTFDSISASPAQPIGVTSLTTAHAIAGYGRSQPLLGMHYAQAMEYAGGSTVTFAGNGTPFSGLMLEIEM